MVILMGLSIGTKDKKYVSFGNQRNIIFVQRTKKPLEHYLIDYHQVVLTTRN
jgi:hypothetical protein